MAPAVQSDGKSLVGHWQKPLDLSWERVNGTIRAPSPLSTFLRRILGSTEEFVTKNGTAAPQQPALHSSPSPSAIHGFPGQGNPWEAKLRGGPGPHPPMPPQEPQVGHQPPKHPAPAFSWSFLRTGRVLQTPQQEIWGAHLTISLWISSPPIPTPPRLWGHPCHRLPLEGNEELCRICPSWHPAGQKPQGHQKSL